MANICDQRVVIVAETDEDMAGALEKMCRNVLSGPAGEEYFSAEDVDGASGNMDALYGLIKLTGDRMNLLCLFTDGDPDTRSESSWLAWRIDHVNGYPVFECDCGLKWSASYDPRNFCEALDPNRFAYSISEGGEAYEWETLAIDGHYFDGSEVPAAVEASRTERNRVKSKQKIAYHVNLAGISDELYSYMDEEW